MGSRSKGPNCHGRQPTGPYPSTYAYKAPMKATSKLARRIMRKHQRGRDFTKFLGYQFAQLNKTRMRQAAIKRAEKANMQGISP